jgi:hypothetical protein
MWYLVLMHLAKIHEDLSSKDHHDDVMIKLKPTKYILIPKMLDTIRDNIEYYGRSKLSVWVLKFDLQPSAISAVFCGACGKHADQSG